MNWFEHATTPALCDRIGVNGAIVYGGEGSLEAYLEIPRLQNGNVPAQQDGAEPESDGNSIENSLFVGDTGELALDTRRALVQLLSGPSLDGRRHPKLWPVLMRDEELIRRRIADLFLELVVDRDLQVAFTRQADTGDLEVPLLLRRAQLTFIDSVLLLYLRHQLIQAESHGERAVVSRDEIIENLSVYERAGNTDRAGFTKRIDASINKIKDRSILQRIRTSDDRFEVSPSLKLLFSAEKIQALTTLYQRMTVNESPVAEDQPIQDEGEES